MEEEAKDREITEIDPEMKDCFNIVKEKVKKATWDGMDNISDKTASRILARKIKAAKIL